MKIENQNGNRAIVLIGLSRTLLKTPKPYQPGARSIRGSWRHGPCSTGFHDLPVGGALNRRGVKLEFFRESEA
jgi:hypothetical protein